MTFDTEKLKAYAALPDDKLWAEIVSLAQNRGIRLPGNVPDHTDMERIRSVLCGNEKMHLSDAARLVNEYKKKYGGGTR